MKDEDSVMLEKLRELPEYQEYLNIVMEDSEMTELEAAKLYMMTDSPFEGRGLE